jgi:hypothetical protein
MAPRFPFDIKVMISPETGRAVPMSAMDDPCLIRTVGKRANRVGGSHVIAAALTAG